ncbi:MAG: DNA-3-methyladenine glycosylase I [Actinobacteria bacterium]|nr:DNA-3-methyladenine glycosylase I [Actinomycetota bacterium]MDQ3532076.1 DNA-3-methyladenine glycosylase I [Actinomycetota bacterium]
MRCFGDGNDLYGHYHDHEWGRPVVDERGLFERICLESFQSGLSWLIVLRKRVHLREVFFAFDPRKVARFGAADVDRLLDDAGTIRNRAKIEAAVANARATLDLRKGSTPLAELIWSFRPRPGGAPRSFAQLPSFTPESTALAKALKGNGFRFFGPTTAYALMQACGLVNDHLAGCVVRDEVARDQASAALGAFAQESSTIGGLR